VKAEESPVELLAELQRYEGARPGGTPIFNDMQFAGFLIYYTPGYRVFIDDRTGLYGDERLLDYAVVMFRSPELIERWAEEYGFELAVVKPATNLGRYLQASPGWVPVRLSAGAGLYRRKERTGLAPVYGGR
jgi:hypothetical protein